MAERLICDAMLGHLARWLRAAGHDAAFIPGIPDADLVARAAAERRVLVTSDQLLMKDRRIQDGAVRAVFVPVEFSHVRQLRHILARLGLTFGAPRCMACGGALEPVEKSAVAETVPARALAAYHEFYRCNVCRKVYWPGTHWERIRRTLDRAARGDDEPQ